jgi:hypothetical protein
MSENNFVPGDGKESDGRELEIVPEEKTPEGGVAKEQAATYQPKGFEEPSFREKAIEFDKENGLLKMSVDQIARLFADACINNLETIKVDDALKVQIEKMKGVLNGWLMGHSYGVAKSEDLAAYLGLEVGKETENVLTKTQGGQGKELAKKMMEKNYWGQFKDQVGL